MPSFAFLSLVQKFECPLAYFIVMFRILSHLCLWDLTSAEVVYMIMKVVHLLWNWLGRFGGTSKSNCIMVPNKHSIWTKKHDFTEVLNRLNKQNDKEKIIVHKSCRVSFRNKIKTFQEKHGIIDLCDSSPEENTRTLTSDSPLKHATRSALEL